MGARVSMGSAWLGMARTACARGDYDEGLEAAELALEAAPDATAARELAATLRAEAGFGDEARAHGAHLCARADASDADWGAYLSSLKLGTPIVATEFADAHRRFGERHRAPRAAAARAVRSGLRRRVLIAGVEAHVALARFLPAVLDGVPDDFELALAFESPSVLELYRARWPHHTYLLLPRGGSARLQATRRLAPDILLDLAGHGPRNVIDLLAARVAPCQVTWLDYLATTGLASVDYRITDAVADPAGNEDFHTESLLRLPFASWCYEPWPSAPPVREPGSHDGVRLACAAVPSKLNDVTLAVFARVLDALPHARLSLFGFRSRLASERVVERLGRTLAARVDFEPRTDPARYLERLSHVDVLLDPIGFSGGTATMDALWQGIPVVTRPLALSHTRTTASLLRTAGLVDWVADGELRYVELVRAAIDEDRSRPGARAARREALRGTPLLDAARFRGAFYEALREIA